MMVPRLFAAALLAISFANVASAADYYSNRTALIVSPVTGTSVIHFVKRGRAYLWAAGSKEFIEGRWSTLPDGALPERACFHFGRERYSPLTGTSGTRMNCVPWASLGDAIVEQLDGDVFGMRTCRVAPFVLGQGRTSLSSLAKKAGVRLTTDVIRTDDLVARPGSRKGPSDKITAIVDELIANPGSYEYRPPDTSGIVPPPCQSPR
jgi:hypothetical protein